MRLFGGSLFLFLLMFSHVYADKSVELYFFNDSVNGIKISDAYETHNMGIVYKSGDFFYGLDLGIVSPDMHVYKNQYRVANRSFGEIVTVTAGRRFESFENSDTFSYLKVKSAGSFGIDSMQDFMHGILTLQPVNAVNDLVRMPDKTWAGVGGGILIDGNESIAELIDVWGVEGYLGSDKLEIIFNGNKIKDYGKWQLSMETGLRFVFFDDIVSAPPISAQHRGLIPYAQLGLVYENNGLKWFIKDKFSLPTIEDDDSVFGVLSAGVTILLN